VSKPQRIAVVLFNLGGPDCLGAVRPFLQNLFTDPSIIQVPTLIRKPLAWLIAKRRFKEASHIYKALGGASPLLPNTQAQAKDQLIAMTAQILA
jgi:ferrochelatase